MLTRGRIPGDCQTHAADSEKPFLPAGFIVAAQATGQGPLANLTAHLSNPFGNNITKNIGRCMIPSSVDVQGIRIPLTCLWPGQQMG